jgi:hypothetical protein
MPYATGIQRLPIPEIPKWSHSQLWNKIMIHWVWWYHVIIWLIGYGSHKKTGNISLFVRFWSSNKTCGTHRMCHTVNLRTYVSRLWTVNLDIWISLLMFLKEENDCSARMSVIASLISSCTSICWSAEGESSGSELCLRQIQYNCGMCHDIRVKRVHKIFMYCDGWHVLQAQIYKVSNYSVVSRARDIPIIWY